LPTRIESASRCFTSITTICNPKEHQI